MVFSVGKHSYFPRNGGIDLAEFVWTQLGCRGQARGGASSLGRLYLQASSFPWLYGPGGGGKTAILQAIAEFLCTQFGPSQSFWAAFFFQRRKEGCDQGHFCSHWSHINSLWKCLYYVNMSIVLWNHKVNGYLSPFPQYSYPDIIDGLNECYDGATQQ